MRHAARIGILILATWGGLGAAQPAAIVTFSRLERAWRTLEESGFADRLAGSDLGRRLGLVERVRQVRAGLLRAERLLDVELLGAVQKIGAGKGFVAFWNES